MAILPDSSAGLGVAYEREYRLSNVVANRQLRAALRYWFDVRGEFAHSRQDIDAMVEQGMAALARVHDGYGKHLMDTLATD